MADDLTFALLAGMLAAVNPCGFAMLPGYLALVVTGPSRAVRTGRALAASGLMTAGFVAVFGIFGLLGAPVAGAAQRYLPVVTVLIGLALVIMGGLLLTGRELTLPLPKPTRGAPTGTIGSMLGYGVAFAIASLSCTIGPFLAAAGVSLSHGEPLAFVAYALGMGLVVAVLAVASALASTAVTTGIRRLRPYLGRIGGALLVLTGAYVAYYGGAELGLYPEADPVADLAGLIQGALSGWLDAAGPVTFLVVLIVLVGGLSLASHRRPTSAAWDDGAVSIDPHKESE